MKCLNIEKLCYCELKVIKFCPKCEGQGDDDGQV